MLRTMVISKWKVVATALVIACVVRAGGVMLVRAQLAQAHADGSAPRAGAHPQDERPPEPRAKKEPHTRIVVAGEGNRSITWRGAAMAGW
jgi:hypothetical protein